MTSKTTLIVVAGVIAANVIAASSASAQLAPGPCTVAQENDVPARMRDGTILMANVLRPKEPGSYPVILMRLPYNKDLGQVNVYAKPETYASHCYIVVIQDVRGQYKSQGEFYPFRNEAQDGYDSVEWAAKLPGSTGKVGMYGFSYVGATQWLAATKKPPSLAAIAPGHTASDYYDGWTYSGGALNLAFIQSWPLTTIALTGTRRLGDQEITDRIVKGRDTAQATYTTLPLSKYSWLSPDDKRVAPYYLDWIRNETRNDYWKQWSIRDRYQDIGVPALSIAGWYDVFLKGGIENFTGMRARGGSEVARKNQKLMIAPYIHIPWTRKVGELDFGPEADNQFDGIQLRWFDHWLKGMDNGIDREPPVKLFVMGANAWREAADWPVPGTEFTSFYLTSEGDANSSFGNGSLSRAAPATPQPADHFVYDPANPVPSRGGNSCCSIAFAPVGPYDQGAIEQRSDVLVYATPPLSEAMEVTGPVTVDLYASSSAVDTDFTAKLVDVYPDGKAFNISQGIVRARYRDSLEKPTPLTPGDVTAFKIALMPTSNLFKSGHRIRLEISSSNFPHYDRNLNTGAPISSGEKMKRANQSVYHDPQRLSRIVLPIMPQPLKAE
jgi:hypothetical protein